MSNQRNEAISVGGTDCPLFDCRERVRTSKQRNEHRGGRRESLLMKGKDDLLSLITEVREVDQVVI